MHGRLPTDPEIDRRGFGMIRVTVWNEYYHETISEAVRAIYPEGIHGAIAAFLSKEEDFEVRAVAMTDPDFGLSDEVLNSTDVLLWWAHVKHHEIPDEIAAKVKERVLKGMGFIALHSAHLCKPFTMLMGTSCGLRWRDRDRERIWNVNPSHPIAQGIGDFFELEQEEMYGEYFDIPVPEDLIFLGWFKGGEVFRSGCTFRRGYGKIFYFQPGHEEHPTYYNSNVQTIIKNAVRWAAPCNTREVIDSPWCESPEKKWNS